MPIAVTPPAAMPTKDMVTATTLPAVSENKKRKIICFSGMTWPPHLCVLAPG